MMKKNRKVIISLTSLSLCMGALCLLPVHALEDSTEKEEVVYANLKHNGSLDQCYVVNIMYPENDTIVDYGNYSSIKNLTTEDKLDFQNNKIKGTTSENELYYQGYLKNTEIPWDIDISYYLNDKEISAKKLAGASGQLKIKMNIQENKKSKDEFFDNYALQASVTLDTNLCRNITAKDATIANVGSDKQLTYTILPGKSKDIEITADVVDFSMDSIAINGVRLNLGIDTDSIDTQTLDEQINEIQTAVQELNDGSQELNDGTAKLTAGASNLQNGIAKIQKGLKELESQNSSLTNGSSEVKAALKQINSSLEKVNMNAEDLKKLSQSSSAISQGIDDLVNGLEKIDTTIDQYSKGVGSLSDVQKSTNQMIEVLTKQLQNPNLDEQTKQLYQQTIQLLKAGVTSEQVLQGIQSQLSDDGELMKGAKTLQKQYQLFDAEIQKLVTSLQSLSSNVSTLKQGVSLLLENYSALDTGIQNYTGGVSQILEGYAQIYNGSINLVDGTKTLYNGTQSMVDGTEEFKNETDNMDQKVNDSIDDMIDDFTASDYETVSFVSENNKNVNSVQFVLKTPSIEQKENTKQEETVEADNNESLLDKILDFFGFGDD